MVGGEQANNEEVKERRKKRKKYAEERRKKLLGEYTRLTIGYDTIRYIYVRSKADEMASLV